MNIHERVQVIPWREEWETTFQSEAEKIKAALDVGGLRAEIYHVGSTSVKGMCSKPIIDILVCPIDAAQSAESETIRGTADQHTAALEQNGNEAEDGRTVIQEQTGTVSGWAEKYITALAQIGYRNHGECGREGRYFLSYGTEENHTFYLHLCNRDHPVARDQLLFQRLERENETIFSNYMLLKRELASLFPENRYMYRTLKGLFIEAVLNAYRRGLPPELDGIRYYVYEMTMPLDAADKLKRILAENELTMDELFQAGIRYIIAHPEVLKEWLAEESDDEIKLIRIYPVHEGETEAQARKRAIDGEKTCRSADEKIVEGAEHHVGENAGDTGTGRTGSSGQEDQRKD